MKICKAVSIMALAILFLSACGLPPKAASSERLQVLASTNILGDVVEQVGGDLIDLSVLMPAGADPHTFEPRPQDIGRISDAELVFTNGLGLEEALEPILETNVSGELVEVSEGIIPLKLEDEHSAGAEPEEEHEHEGGDPHTWTDPNNLITWVENIEAALVNADPDNAAAYRANAAAYVLELKDLDSWIRTEIKKIPPERRKLVTDHAIFGYFADEYGLEQVGLIVGSLSTNASPSAQELAQLEDRIRAQGVPAVFVGTTVNSNLAAQVAKDTGAELVSVYTDSLSEAGGEASTYLDLMRYNVRAIVEALK